MTRFKQALVIALGVGLAAIMVVLGFWQLQVYHRQGAAAAARQAPRRPSRSARWLERARRRMRGMDGP